MKDHQFQYKKAQIENFLKKEFKRKFGRNKRVSIRKRRKFMADVTQKIARKFGKDVLCLVDFNKQGFVSLVSPSKTLSTDKGQLFQSFTHMNVSYTSHCIERFSQRTETTENCIITLDGYMDDALLTYGQHDAFLICPAGVFAYELENDSMVVKTYINYELLSSQQVKEFYGSDSIWHFPEDLIAENILESDIILSDERIPPISKIES